MFERFTEPAREVVVLAQGEARTLRHGYIGTEHLLMGVLREGTGVGSRVLEGLGIGLETVRADVVNVIGRGPTQGEEQDAEALRAIGIDIDEVRRRIEEAFGPGALDRSVRGRRRRRRAGRCSPVGHIPFTPKAKKVLQLSLREATALGHNYIGTEHILLGLVREHEGVASQLLRDRGAGERDVRRLVAEEIARGKDLPGRSA
jgi:ATP-dependent Clp protease ATP-binding subunit ClpA